MGVLLKNRKNKKNKRGKISLTLGTSNSYIQMYITM